MTEQNNEFAVEIPTHILADEQQKKTIKKEKQKQYFKKWYDENIKEQKKRVICECGIEVCYMNLCNHRKTKRHNKLIHEKNKVDIVGMLN